MNNTREKALHHLTGNSDEAGIPLEYWQQLAEQYPYFAPAQFFLASKLRQRSPSAAAAQQVKTALYFSNPYWLQYQLQSSVAVVADKAEKAVIPTLESIRETMRNIDRNQSIQDEPEEPAPEEEDTLPEEALEEQENLAETKLSNILSEQFADFKKPVDNNDKLDIETQGERLHTVDYFASQGIKIDLDKLPQDKLSSHLRKFTDWLKEMKNPQTGQAGADLGTTAEMEDAVAEIAKTSNVSREVLTEAMAEVLVKQGQVAKAIHLLGKLSFINPEKSSYFAARIEQLKGII
ncbi:hypothetical protein [Sediminibacterium soli]|uniref:hypothetical protein n=1 Tax=Sediminibacterium soli TaxID=2698829 RepID=UPI0013797422|nr:hypothetical protein [Sediminibacterium soli]NCI46019.1 hypothetical protein [Sediminibacterium soli]